MNSNQIYRRIQPVPVKPLHGGFWVIGHRGYAGIAPENTLTSLKFGLDAGVDMIEFDVTLSKDRVPVLFHDRRLERTTNGNGRVYDKTFKELRGLDAGGWFSKKFRSEKIPTLDEALDLLQGQVAINVEIKREAVKRKLDGGIEEMVLQAIEKRGIRKQTIISSQSWVAIERIKKNTPDQPAAIILPMFRIQKAIPRMEKIHCDEARISHVRLRKRFVRELTEHEIPLRVFTVNDVDTLKRLIRWGVNGIFTDQCDRMVREVRRLFPNEQVA